LARYRRLRGEDLYEEGRRRHHLALVRRPGAEDQPAHRSLRLDRRGQLRARRRAGPLQGREPGGPARHDPLAPAGSVRGRGRARLRACPLRGRTEPAAVRGKGGQLMKHAVARRRKGYEHEIEMGEHRVIADEPEATGGRDQGPTPTELLAASLASCTAITI